MAKKIENLGNLEDNSEETPEQAEVSKQLKEVASRAEQPKQDDEKQLSPDKKEEKEKNYYGLSMEEQYQLIGEQLKNREGKKNDNLVGKDYKTLEELCDDLQGRTVIEGEYGGFYRLRSNEITAELARLQKQVEEELSTKSWEEIMQKLGYFGNSYETFNRGIEALEKKFPELKRLSSSLQKLEHSFESEMVQARIKREGLTSEDYEKLWQKEQDRRYRGKDEPQKGEPKKKKSWFRK